MNHSTGERRGARRAGLVAVLATATMLVTGCGVQTYTSYRSTPAQDQAFARCVRSHGLPESPAVAPKEAVAAHAFDVCLHLLGPGHRSVRIRI